MLVAPPGSMLLHLLGLYYGGMYRESTEMFLPSASCPMCSTLLLGLGKGDGKNDRHCGSCLHLATVSCLYLNRAQLSKESSGG